MTATDGFIEVVAAIIRSPDARQVLLARRGAHQHQGGRWEFPGGKVDAGESLADALVRELEEELGIRPLHWSAFETIDFRYPDKAVRLHFQAVTAFAGTARGREGQTIRWVALEDLAGLEFPPANAPVVARLRSAGGSAPAAAAGPEAPEHSAGEQ